MKGRAHAARNRHDGYVVTAWHTNNFSRMKQPKDLSHYLRRPDEPEEPAVQPAVILDAMLTLQSCGVPVAIKRIK